MSLRRYLRLGLVCYCILSSLSMPTVIAFPTIPGAVHPDCKCHLNDRMSGTCCCAGSSCCGKPKASSKKKVASSCCMPKTDASMCRSDAPEDPAPTGDQRPASKTELTLSPCGCGGPVSHGGLIASDPRLVNTRARIEGPAPLVVNCCNVNENWIFYEEAPATPPPKQA